MCAPHTFLIFHAFWECDKNIYCAVAIHDFASMCVQCAIVQPHATINAHSAHRKTIQTFRTIKTIQSVRTLQHMHSNNCYQFQFRWIWALLRITCVFAIKHIHHTWMWIADRYELSFYTSYFIFSMSKKYIYLFVLIEVNKLGEKSPWWKNVQMYEPKIERKVTLTIAD